MDDVEAWGWSGGAEPPVSGGAGTSTACESASHPTFSGRLANGRFGAGNPGRPPGSRNRLTQRLVSAILADFERHREQVLTHLRHDHAAAYARLVARFLPPGTLGGLEEAPAAPPALAGLPREALDDALATLGTALDDIDWSALGRAEDLLLRETARARLVAEVAAAMGRNNGENTVAEAADEGAAADLAGAER